MKSKLAVTLLSFTIVFCACKKDSNNNDTSKTKTELISQGSWKFSGATAQGLGDVTSSVPACYKDNIYSFVTDGSGTIDESTNICSPSNAGPFEWSFTNNETDLHISTPIFPWGTSDFNLITLTETTIQVSQTMTIGSLPPAEVQITFVHP